MELYTELISMVLLGCGGMLVIPLLFIIGCLLIAAVRDFFDEYF